MVNRIASIVLYSRQQVYGLANLSPFAMEEAAALLLHGEGPSLLTPHAASTAAVHVCNRCNIVSSQHPTQGEYSRGV